MPTHTEALFGYSYRVAGPHFIRDLALDADCTLTSHLALVLNYIYYKIDLPLTVTCS